MEYGGLAEAQVLLKQMVLDHVIPLHRWSEQATVLEKYHSRKENTTFIVINDNQWYRFSTGRKTGRPTCKAP